MQRHQNLEEIPRLSQSPLSFYIKKSKRQFVFGILSLMITNGLDALPPLLLGMVLDQITQGKSFGEISQTLILLFVVAVFLSLFRYLWRLQWGQYSHRAAQDLRNKIFSQFLHLDQQFFQAHPVGKLMSLINNDVNAFRMAIGPGILILLDAFFISLFVIPIMYTLSPSLLFKSLILLPLIPFLIAKIESKIHDDYKLQQKKFSGLSGFCQEVLTGIRTIKSFTSEDKYIEKFDRQSKSYENTCNSVARTEAFFSPIMEMSVAFGCVILLFTAQSEVTTGAITIGGLFSFYQYIQRMTWPMTAIGIGLTFWQKGKASMGRILDLFQTENNVPDSGNEHLSRFESLEFKNLSFNYNQDPNEFGLKDISFKLEAGQSLGILGETGSGKSTLVELILSLYKTNKNTIFINNLPLESYKQESLRKVITYIPQSTFLFSDSVENNLKLSLPENKVSEISPLLATVKIDQEIKNLPDGLQEKLGENGVNLSGGQKQRLAIVRGILRSSPLIIFDDTFSAIDAETESQILSAINSQLQEKSTIIISHRLASLKLADKLLILKDGKISGYGSHMELLDSNPIYQNIYNTQVQGGK